MAMRKKFALQEQEYEFPYHYLPRIEDGNSILLHRYLEWGLDYMTYMRFVVDLIRQSSPKSLCDVGCGDGRLLNMIESFVPDSVGIDVSKRAISLARAFNPSIEIVHGDVSELSRTFQWITLIEVLEHIPDAEMAGFVANVSRIMDPGGYLLITVPTVNVPLHPKHYRHYNLEILKATLQSRFQIEQHWWLYKTGLLEKVLRNLLVNRVFVLNLSLARRLIWQIHKRLGYTANTSNGAHLVCIARLRIK